MQHLFHAIALVFTGVAVVGCNWPPTGTGSSSSPSSGTASTPIGDPPIITAADMSGSAAPNNGVYTIFGSLTYSCDDDVVHTVRVSVPVVGKSYDFPGPDTADGYGTPFNFTLVDDIPLAGAGPTNYSIILITKGGAQSAPFPETVDLQ
jgi:hypothetical protein